MKTRNKVFVGSGITLMLLLLAGFGLVWPTDLWAVPAGALTPGFMVGCFSLEVMAGIWPISSSGGWIKKPRNSS